MSLTDNNYVGLLEGLPPPADPSEPKMSEWISRKAFWIMQRDSLTNLIDRSGWGGTWDDECEDLWQNTPEAWFAKYEPLWEVSYGCYFEYLLWMNGRSVDEQYDDEIPYA